jgi:hypothetical protein
MEDNLIIFFKNTKMWKDSAEFGLAIIGVAGAVMGILGLSFADFFVSRVVRLYVIVIIYIVIVVFVVFVKFIIVKRGIAINVNGITVYVKQGCLFNADGWKIIPFNEYFDTTVDDKVISHSSLNGVFIDKYVDDIPALQLRIEEENKSKTCKKSGRIVYHLGHIITYNDFMLLALTHFNNQNMAHISKLQYEQCLMAMWHEISRTYAGKPVFLPLLGSGITRFDDVPNKSYFDLLKCMICTLKSSGENFNVPITILLTTDIMQKLNLYEVKGAI